jgi:hypothetical protein
MTSTSKRPLLGITMGGSRWDRPRGLRQGALRPGHFYRLPANDHR